MDKQPCNMLLYYRVYRKRGAHAHASEANGLHPHHSDTHADETRRGFCAHAHAQGHRAHRLGAHGRDMTLARIKNVIFALAAMICLILSAPARTPARAQSFGGVQTAQATAENEEIPHVSAVDYLDYRLESPRAVFASDGRTVRM